VKIACVLITHLRAKVEMRRQPDLRDRAVLIVERTRSRPLVIDHFPAASGVAAGMTLEQALSRQAEGIVLEADEAHYRRVFHRTLISLQGMSDRVEGGELGIAYVRLDGLEALYGGEARLVNALLNAVPQYLMPRVGVGDAKFPAYAAARSSRPLGAVQAPPDAAGFLAPQPVDLLPIPARVKAEMRRFGLHTLGDVAAMKVEALTGRFGPEGRRAWELSLGIDDAPLAPLQHEESVVERTVLPFSSASLELLLTAADTLLRRAYAQPRIRGRYAGGASLECILYRAQPWHKEFHFKQPVGDWQRASRIIRGQLEAGPPQAPVEEVTLALSHLTGESGVQLSLLADLRGDRERRLAEAERQLQARMDGRPVLYRVVRVAPWHPAPEMRAMRVPIEASGIDGMKPLSAPTPVTVEEGRDGQPAAVRLGERWHRLAGVEDLWCFDLWWMPQPLTRTYYRVARECGGEVTLFRDRREDRWFRQDS
jgi:nucleotidyltransferase/DNA polymerase involved in DNA repair